MHCDKCGLIKEGQQAPIESYVGPCLQGHHFVTTQGITFEEAQLFFDELSRDGKFTAEEMKSVPIIIGQVLEAIALNYPRARQDLFDYYLINPPSTQSSSHRSSSDSTREDSSNPVVFRNRNLLPKKLNGPLTPFSSTTATSLGVETVSFPQDTFDTTLMAPDIHHQHMKLARLLIKWSFYSSQNISAFSSPSKPLSPKDDSVKAVRLSESFVQTCFSRVLFPLCEAIGITLHDARSHPKLFLRHGRLNLAGYSDFLFCHKSTKNILGFLEVKVFMRKSHLGQLFSTNLSVSAGVNGCWDSAQLSDHSAAHVFGSLCNMFCLLRCQTRNSNVISIDQEPLSEHESLDGLYRMLKKAMVCHEDAMSFSFSSLSIRSQNENKDPSDLGGGRGELHTSNGRAGLATSQRGRRSGGGQGKEQERPGRQLQSKPLTSLNLLAHNIDNSDVPRERLLKRWLDESRDNHGAYCRAPHSPQGQ